MEFNLDHFPDETVHARRLLGQNTGVVYLDTMAQVYAVFSYGGLLRMCHTDVVDVL
jgi:hypothetical protein